ncbi:antitoxin HicB [Yersinia entomophaga]|uniref:Antitoxin HicB n=1 Tax=Yersinia entomophaga TaxID=935293 RepID=A0ABM6BPQ0_YERET|nr:MULTISPECIES: antitoxin HicB [Yersinia]ANI31350.1 antitoxin HicB [Yersinia entomophaga]OWF90124.1 hypothetical protein B4914_01055 [Yersinia entomophaga]
MFSYPASYLFDETSGEYQIHFRDFPEVQSVTYSIEDVELEAQDSLKTAIAVEMEERRSIPAPSMPEDNEFSVHLPILVTLKAELHNGMIASGTRKADLARKLGLNAAQMERLLDVDYASKVEALEQALYLLGYEAHVVVRKIESIE